MNIGDTVVCKKLEFGKLGAALLYHERTVQVHSHRGTGRAASRSLRLRELPRIFNMLPTLSVNVPAIKMLMGSVIEEHEAVLNN